MGYLLQIPCQIWSVLREISKKVLPESRGFDKNPSFFNILKSCDSLLWEKPSRAGIIWVLGVLSLGLCTVWSIELLITALTFILPIFLLWKCHLLITLLCRHKKQMTFAGQKRIKILPMISSRWYLNKINSFEEQIMVDISCKLHADASYMKLNPPLFSLKRKATIVPTKSDSHVIFCLQLLSI